jgi:DNA-binding NarL/FixJ family response regulator
VLESRTDFEVVGEAEDGLMAVEIVERLLISPRTAETHRTRILRKLQLHSQAELVLFALQHGLIDAS